MGASRRIGIIAPLCAVALVTGVAACASDPGEGADRSPAPTPTQEAPRPSASPTPQPEPTEDPPADAPVVIPACPEILTEAQIVELLSSGYAPVPEPDASRLYEVHRNVLGPVARQSLDGAAQVEHCAWGIPNSDAVLHMIVAELPTGVRDHLIAELRNSVYEESTMAGITVFRDPEGAPHVGSNWYGFRGPLWVALVPGSDGIGSRVFESLSAANRGLAID